MGPSGAAIAVPPQMGASDLGVVSWLPSRIIMQISAHDTMNGLARTDDLCYVRRIRDDARSIATFGVSLTSAEPIEE